MSKQNPTIMVVEDETLLLQAISKKLKLSNLDVISCATGQQAIDYLKNLDEMPDVVWLDYYLKDMNGLAFMENLKKNPKWMHIPVVVVSNSANPEKVSHVLALGAKKYILKAEYRLDEIIAMMREFINEATGGTVGASDTPAAGGGSSQPASLITAVPSAGPSQAQTSSSGDTSSPVDHSAAREHGAA